MGSVINTPQRSEAWFAARRGIPTASRFDRILTAAKGLPSASQSALIDELIAESICPPDVGLIKQQYTSDEMLAGIRLEAEGRCCYELEFAKWPVHEVGFVLHASGMFGGSPDALVGDVGGVEIKCPAAATHVGYIREGGLPPAYKCQVHGYMVVTGRKQWSFFSYARNFEPFHLNVEADAFTAKLEAELLAFCARYNEARAKFNLPPIGVAQQQAA
jgi:hypothetical protein